MTDRLVIVWPDTHHHYHDQRAVDNVLEMISDHHPDEVLLIGDFIDCKAPARWSRGTAAEYLADLQRESESAQRTLESLREAQGPGGAITFIRGNHEHRLDRYVASYAPALKGIVSRYPDLMDFERWGVREVPATYRVAPGVIGIHGERLSSTQQAAGQSAYRERVRHGHSIVQGHSHRLGLGFDTSDKTRFWMEAGWLGDAKKADYLSFRGVANWQQGFGYLIVNGTEVHPGVVPIRNRGRFYFEGTFYG